MSTNENMRESQLKRIEVLLRAADSLPEVLEILRTASEGDLNGRLGALLGATDPDLLQVVRDARLETFRPRSIARLTAAAVELREGRPRNSSL